MAFGAARVGVLTTLVLSGAPGQALARGPEAPSELRAPVPEPILGETVTDIDGVEAGEVEVEANGSVLRALRGGARALDTSLEVEWLAARAFGLRLEPALSQDLAAGGATSAGAGATAGTSWKWLQDFQHDLYADAELTARAPWGASGLVQPGDPELPVALDARAALRRGALTLRASLGVGILGPAEHLPLRGSAAALLPFEPSGRFGFWGIEIDADGARDTPFIAALDVVPNFEPAGLPLRIGLALPWAVGARDDRPSVGFFLRVFYESARELEFAAPRGTDPPR